MTCTVISWRAWGPKCWGQLWRMVLGSPIPIHGVPWWSWLIVNATGTFKLHDGVPPCQILLTQTYAVIQCREPGAHMEGKREVRNTVGSKYMTPSCPCVKMQLWFWFLKLYVFMFKIVCSPGKGWRTNPTPQKHLTLLCFPWSRLGGPGIRCANNAWRQGIYTV